MAAGPCTIRLTQPGVPGVCRAGTPPFGREFPRASVIVTLFSAACVVAVVLPPLWGGRLASARRIVPSPPPTPYVPDTVRLVTAPARPSRVAGRGRLGQPVREDGGHERHHRRIRTRERPGGRQPSGAARRPLAAQ